MLYVQDGGRQGMVQMTNIVPWKGAWYLLAMRGQPAAPGTCVWRSLDVTDGSAWRGWDGADFNVVSLDRTMRAVRSPFAPPRDRRSCASASWSDVLGCWLSVGLGLGPSGEPAFVYGTSDDLFS